MNIDPALYPLWVKTLLATIAELDPESFPVVFKKSFLVLLSLARETLHYLKTKDKEGLQRIYFQDQEVNKTTNLCLRMLSKKMNDRRKIVVLAGTLKAIEKMGDGLGTGVERFLFRRHSPKPVRLSSDHGAGPRPRLPL
jgi:phosphate uptake regulator